MKFSFTGRHMDIGETLTQRAHDASIALADKYGTEFLDMNIVMKKDGYRFLCDISCKTKTGNSYHMSNEAEDPIVCFESTMQKIEHQMQKKKKCSRCCSCKDGFLEMNEIDNSFADEEADAPMIIAEILHELPALSVSEAASQLNDKAKVIVFENVVNDSINVVYKRDDGNIGWIDYKK